jgi:hypothetical protein
MTGWLWGLLGGLLVNELFQLCGWAAQKLVRWSAQIRYDDPERAEIRAEELARVIEDRPAELLKLFTAVCFVFVAVRAWVGRAVSRMPITGVTVSSTATARITMATTMVTAMATMAAAVLALNATHPQPTIPSAPQVAQVAALPGWIAREVAPSAVVSCDPEMCNELERSGFPASHLLVLGPSENDPLGSVLVVATPVIRSQFGTRLANVYAPLVIASFGSGTERVDVRYVAPGGSAAFESELAADRNNRIAAGEVLLGSKGVQVSATARKAFLAGQVDPRLLVTLSALADLMSIRLVAFDDSSPGGSADVPLRGVELGAATTADLATIVTFLRGQKIQLRPAVARITQIANGQHVVTVRYDAPGPMGLGGS